MHSRPETPGLVQCFVARPNNSRPDPKLKLLSDNILGPIAIYWTGPGIFGDTEFLIPQQLNIMALAPQWSAPPGVRCGGTKIDSSKTGFQCALSRSSPTPR